MPLLKRLQTSRVHLYLKAIENENKKKEEQKTKKRDKIKYVPAPVPPESAWEKPLPREQTNSQNGRENDPQERGQGNQIEEPTRTYRGSPPNSQRQHNY
ncbi:hypothetical protein JTB14_001082 [Gonioctena quinquepunctata]|nr:hypothetical protein JTB14_001082 [Gonioctena quinquepunctata]